MPVTVQHVLTATTPDDPDYEIRPSHWNSAHALTLSLAGSEVSPVFSNANGISFGLSGTAVTGSYTVPSVTQYLTTAMLSNASSAFAGIGETVTTVAGTNLGLTVDTSGVQIAHPAWLTTAQPVGAYLTTARASNDAIGLNTALTANGVAWTVNSSGLSLNVPAFLTTAALSDHSHGNPTLALTNLSGTTASASNGFTLSLSAAAPGAGGGAALKGSGTYTQNTGTVEFGNSNGITFGLSNNGTMTASHNGLTTARASNDAVGLNTALTAGPLAWTVNSGGISLNAGSAAGTSTGFTGANISASITHNTAGLAISASVAAPGGGADKSASFHIINDGNQGTAALWNNATYSNRPIFMPFKMGEALTAVNTICIYASRTGGTSAAATLFAGIYTIANATSMNLVSSTSFNLSLTTSAQFSGIRKLHFTGLGALSLSPGQYVMGLMASMPGTESWGMNAIGNNSLPVAGLILPGTNSTAATNSASYLLPFHGVFKATSAALPSAVAMSSISGGNGANSPKIFVALKAIG